MTNAAPVWSGEYWAQKGDVRLYMYRKRLGAPVASETPKPVLVLVHGSSISSRASFDLTVPGQGEYSTMNVFAHRGYDVWTLDHEGYGRSARTTGNSDIASGAADLMAAVTVLQKETGHSRFHFMGESSGALRCGFFAQQHPQHVARLVLSASTHTGKGSPALIARARQAEFYRTHNRRPRGPEQIRSLFSHEKPQVYEMAMVEALIAAETPLGNDVPSGTYLDMTTNLPIVDPRNLAMPVLLVRGEHDAVSTIADLQDFHDQLPGTENQFAILPAAAHMLGLGRNRAAFWNVVHGFLSRDTPV